MGTACCIPSLVSQHKGEQQEQQQVVKPLRQLSILSNNNMSHSTCEDSPTHTRSPLSPLRRSDDDLTTSPTGEVTKCFFGGSTNVMASPPPIGVIDVGQENDLDDDTSYQLEPINQPPVLPREHHHTFTDSLEKPNFTVLYLPAFIPPVSNLTVSISADAFGIDIVDEGGALGSGVSEFEDYSSIVSPTRAVGRPDVAHDI